MNYFQKELIRLFGSDVVKFECERRNLHKKEETIAPAIPYGEIDGQQLCRILPEKYMLDGKEYYCRRYVRDIKYKVTSLDEYKRFLKWDLTQRAKYVPEYNDCDDFQIILAARVKLWTSGLAFGLADVPGHAKNIGVAHYQGKMIGFMVEPQSDVIGIPLDPVIPMWWV